MTRRFLILMFLAVIVLAVPLRAQAPAAHGSEKAGHEIANSDRGHGEAHKAPKTYFGIPGWMIKLVNMVVFIGLLGYLLIGPIRTSFAARREQIRKQLREAHARRENADRLAHDIEARLAQIEADVNAILERAKLEGEKQKQELLAAAEADAKKLLASARAEVDARVKMARHELTALAADLATDRATALLRDTMTEADRKRLFDESLGEIGVTR